MEFVIHDDTNKILEVTIKDVDLSIINSIRRIILAEIQTVAFFTDSQNIDKTDIKVLLNTTVLNNNEFLAHRVSLIPLFFDENETNNFDPQRYRFELKKKNTGTTVVNVTTKDFRIYDENGKEYDKSFRDRILPANEITNDHILLMKLKPNLYDTAKGEALEIECFGSVDIGQRHSRWCPVSTCCFSNVVDEDAAEKEIENRLKKSNASDKEKESLKKQFYTLEYERFYKKNKYHEPSEILFTVETECNLRPKYLVYKALVVLSQKVSKFSENLTKNDGSVVVDTIGENFYQISIKNESYTLLNVLQCYIYNQTIRDDPSHELDFIGYYEPHPLDPLMFLKIKYKSNSKTDIPYLIHDLETQCQNLVEHLENVTRTWIEQGNLLQLKIDEIAKFYQ